MRFFFQTERLKYEIRTKVLMSDLEDVFDRPTFNQTALRILLDNVRAVRENTTRAVSALETVLYLIRPPEQGDTLKQMLGVSTCKALKFKYCRKIKYINNRTDKSKSCLQIMETD